MTKKSTSKINGQSNSNNGTNGTAQSATDTSIHSRALLVWLTISTWSARRYDKTVTAKVNRDYAASTDAGRYNKMLLPGDAPAYKSLVTIAGAIRAAHYGHTLAWSDEGWRLLPIANYMEYTTWYRDQQRAFSAALDSFVSDYPSMRASAAIKLGTMYKSEDYPSTEDMRSRFALSVQYSPVPMIGDIRVELGADQILSIETSIQNRISNATKTAVDDAYQRLFDVVSHVVNRLSDPEAIFRDSLIMNAKETCAVLKRLNITNDPQLETMRARVESELCKYHPDVLRDNKKQRRQTADQASEIMRQMSGMFGSSSQGATL